MAVYNKLTKEQKAAINMILKQTRAAIEGRIAANQKNIKVSITIDSESDVTYWSVLENGNRNIISTF